MSSEPGRGGCARATGAQMLPRTARGSGSCRFAQCSAKALVPGFRRGRRSAGAGGVLHLLPSSLHSRRTEQLVANLCWALVTAAGDPH